MAISIPERQYLAKYNQRKMMALPPEFIDAATVGGVPLTRSSSVANVLLARTTFTTPQITDGAAGDYVLVPRDSESLANPFSLGEVGAGGGAVIYAVRFDVSTPGPDGRLVNESENLRRVGELVIVTSDTSAPIYLPVSQHMLETGGTAMAGTTAPAVAHSTRAGPAEGIRFANGASFLYTADKPNNLKIRLKAAIGTQNVVVTMYADAILVDRPTAQLLTAPLAACGAGAADDASVRATLRAMPSLGR